MKALRPSFAFTILFLFAPSISMLAQWTKNESLTGGSIVTDIIEFNQSLFASYNETGIFRSTDHGETWSQTPVPGQFNFTRMVVTGNRLVAISYGKTYFTTNGTDWTEGAGPEAFINDADSEGDVIFVATHLGIYKSPDQGVSWQYASDPQVQVALKSISISGANVWASAETPGGTLFMSGNSGTSWTKVIKGTIEASDVATTPTEVYISIPDDAIYRSTNQGTDWQLVRNLKNSFGKMVVSEAGIFYADAYNLYYSKNSGTTWQQKSKSYPTFNFNCLYANAETFYMGLWGGGILTTSHTDQSADWRFINKGIACQYIYDFAFDGNRLYAGLENSFLRISEDLGATWSQKSGAFGLFAFSVRALMVKSDAIYTGSGGDGIFKSTDGGDTWTEKNQGLVSKNIYSIVSTANAIFVASDDGVYKSTNEGDSWTKKTADGLSMRKLYSNGTALYAACYNGLYESKNDGETWNMINGGLPQLSVNDVITMGPAVLAATQFNGVYKTTNSGSTWKKMNDFYVQLFSKHNEYIFMSTLGGQVLMSGDTAKTGEDVAAALPGGAITYGGVIGDDIIVAKANLGYWTRKATTVLKPYVMLTSPRAQNKLSLTESITLQSDQRLFSAADVPISDANIGTFISVVDNAGNTIAFSAHVASGEKAAILTIVDSKLGEVYTVKVSPLLNEAGLSSLPVLAKFTVVKPTPILADVRINMEEDRKAITLNKEIFRTAYRDDQPMTEVMVKTLPANGQLKIGETPVTVNQVISVNTIDNLVYMVNPTFSGNDSWNWNASDGDSYADADAKVTIVVPIVTGISEVSGPEIIIYPNPASSRVQVELGVIDFVSLKVFDVMGRQMPIAHLSPSHRTDRVVYVIDTQSYTPGVYFVCVNFGGRQVVSKFIKQ